MVATCLSRGSSHRQRSFPCAGCPGAFTAPSQKRQPLAELWIARLVCPLPGTARVAEPARFCTAGRLGGVQLAADGETPSPARELPGADGDMLARLGCWGHSWSRARTCVSPVSAGGRDGKHLEYLLFHTVEGAKRPAMWVILSQSAPLAFLFVLSERKRKWQKKGRWRKTRGSKCIF